MMGVMSSSCVVSRYLTSGRDITERPHAPSGVAAFVSAHSKTPYITPSMDISSGQGVVRGAGGSSWYLRWSGAKHTQLLPPTPPSAKHSIRAKQRPIPAAAPCIRAKQRPIPAAAPCIRAKQRIRVGHRILFKSQHLKIHAPACPSEAGEAGPYTYPSLSSSRIHTKVRSSTSVTLISGLQPKKKDARDSYYVNIFNTIHNTGGAIQVKV